MMRADLVSNGMRSRLKRGLLLAGLMAALTGCGGLESEYQPSAVIIPPYIKTIAVRPFENESATPGIGNKLWLAVTDEFIRDGRIKYVDNESEADGVVVGTVKREVETPLTFDSNLVPTEYQLWVIMDLKFLDKSKNQYLWHEPYLEHKLRYFAETEPGGLTLEEAREELWDRFAQDIVRRVIEGFGTVTSSSPRSVPKDVPDNPPPDYPSTSPF